jgi:hypothetical protein
VTHTTENTATAQQSPGCTLADYAEAKGIPVEVLNDYGLSEMTYMGAPAVRIPYFAEADTIHATRYRIAMSGPDKFRWKAGDKTCLYGQWRRRLALDAGYVCLVEGESDCHTLWFHDIPAVGIPGANNWNEARDASYFDGIDRVYIVIEPDRGGETVMQWLSHSAIRDRAYLVDLGEYKDPSGLYGALRQEERV